MKKVLVFGTFDNIHPGHEFFLNKAARQGKSLIAVVARDRFVRGFKGKTPLHDESYRLATIRNHPLVEDAYLADEEIGRFSILMRLNPDLICLGHDQHALEESLRAWLSKEGLTIPIKRLPPYKRDQYSSTLLNRFIRRKPS